MMAGSGEYKRARLAVLLSGSGRTLENLLQASGKGTLAADVVLVVSSKSGVRGLEIAGRAGIPAVVVNRANFPHDTAFSASLFSTVAEYAPDLIICAGFLKRLVVEPGWEGRILNIHPALIPESHAAGAGFYGLRVHSAVIESGASVSGATVHVVDNEYDHGPVVMKRQVPVLPADSAEDLAARVFAAECELYPEAIAYVLAERAAKASGT
jgi:phosphoribosylglycinamide formyltransferase 1